MAFILLIFNSYFPLLSFLFSTKSAKPNDLTYIHLTRVLIRVQ
nr:MAG TPA: hypothetical protein [Caudoviricetes sp.]